VRAAGGGHEPSLCDRIRACGIREAQTIVPDVG
jgi:hypothetical protein